MFDIYGKMKEPPVREPFKVQKTGGKNDEREKPKPRRMMQVPYRVDRYRNACGNGFMVR